MSNKERIRISNSIEKALMKNKSWKGYVQGLKDGELIGKKKAYKLISRTLKWHLKSCVGVNPKECIEEMILALKRKWTKE